MIILSIGDEIIDGDSSCAENLVGFSYVETIIHKFSEGNALNYHNEVIFSNSDKFNSFCSTSYYVNGKLYKASNIEVPSNNLDKKTPTEMRKKSTLRNIDFSFETISKKFYDEVVSENTKLKEQIDKLIIILHKGKHLETPSE